MHLHVLPAVPQELPSLCGDFLIDGGLCSEVGHDACGAVLVGRVVCWEHVHERKETPVPLAKGKDTVSRYSRSRKVYQNYEEFWYT